MGRYSQGWKIRLPEGRTIYTVFFTHNGRRVDRSTGCSDQGEASKAAARIYADFVQREPPKRRIVRRGDSLPLPELVEQWLSGDTTIDEDTVDTWTVYGGHWSEHFPTIADITEAEAVEYRNKRLRSVLASTVRKELSALRRFLAWCELHGHIGRAVTIPGVPEKTTGKRYEKRRRSTAPELTPKQIETIIAKLPAWSGSKKVPPFPIQARFIVAYQTSLRPGTLDSLSVPEHYHKGSDRLMLTDDIDKARWGREIPLTERARKALDAVLDELDELAAERGEKQHRGLIFGKHDYREALDKAAKKVLSPAVAERFCGAHFRSAAITHTLEQTSNLAGAQYMAGHKQPKTTANYVKPSFRAAENAILARSGTAAPSAAKKRKRA